MILIPVGEGDALIDVDGVARRLGLTVSAVNQRMYGHSSTLPPPLSPEHAAELVFPGETPVLAAHRVWLADLLRRAGGRKPMRLWLRSAVIESDPKRAAVRLNYGGPVIVQEGDAPTIHERCIYRGMDDIWRVVSE